MFKCFSFSDELVGRKKSDWNVSLVMKLGSVEEYDYVLPSLKLLP
jgi:hypothetical protein